VVFLDDWKWHAFHQLAPPLRRAGIRTIRISTADLRRTHVGSRLLFDDYAILPKQHQRENLLQILDGEAVVDIQFSESLASLVHEISGSLRPALAEHLRRRLFFMNKSSASRVFAQAGLRTPAGLVLKGTSPQQVAAEIGFPLVVKPMVGCGGAGVVIVNDDAELRAAMSAAEHPEVLFCEKFIVGTKLDYGASVSASGIEQEITYRVSQWQPPAGRATEIETIDDPQLRAFGRSIVAVAGCTGLVNMDVIRDNDGLDWLIDFNPRVFGSSGALRAAGMDISEGYLKALGGRSDPPRSSEAPPGVRIEVFPTNLEQFVDEGSIARAASAFLRESWPYLRWLGWRYWLSEALVTAMSISSSRVGRTKAHSAVPAALPPDTRDGRRDTSLPAGGPGDVAALGPAVRCITEG